MVYYGPGEPDTVDYVSYFQNQAGCGLPGYSGSGVMYGAGVRRPIQRAVQDGCTVVKKRI